MQIRIKIISVNSIDKLNEAVQSMIDEDWLPQGGVTAANGTNFIFGQAMVKEEV